MEKESKEKKQAGAMANLRSDSPICRRVVRAFLDFLNSVQPASGVDLEGLDVARECLEEIFKLNSFSNDDGIQPGMLIDLFSSLENGEQHKEKLNLGPSTRESTSCITSSSQEVENLTNFKASNAKDQVGGPHVIAGGDSNDELLGKFLASLDKVNFFKTSPDGIEDSAQVAKAAKFFNDALMEMETSEGEIIHLSKLAEMFKLKGNRFMQSKSYSEAIELYTCAIALCERNAVYYCNRAAAFTQVHRYAEAIEDCLKSIEINPNYSKAYSRLGLAYYAQENYGDALNKGFLKALQLDPSNDSVKENIRVAQQKLMEQCRRAEASQNMGPYHRQQSSAQSGGSPNQGVNFASFTFDGSAVPEYPDLFESTRSAGRGDSSSFSPFNPPTAPPPPTPATPPTPPDTSSTNTQSAGSTHHNTQFTSFPFNTSTPEFANMFRAATQAAGSTNSSTPFTSFPLNTSAPAFAEVLRTVASTAQGHQTHERRPSGTSEGTDGPEIRMDENTSFRFGEAPEQVSNVLRSVMGMFSSQHGSQQDTHRGSNGA